MKKITLFLGAALLVAGTVAFLPRSASAYRGDVSVKGPNYTVERHEAMTEAFAKKDYNAWKTLVGDRGVARKVNAENFGKFAEAHELQMQGKTAEAAKIRLELGLGQRNGTGNGGGNGMGCGGSRGM